MCPSCVRSTDGVWDHRGSRTGLRNRGDLSSKPAQCSSLTRRASRIQGVHRWAMDVLLASGDLAAAGSWKHVLRATGSVNWRCQVPNRGRRTPSSSRTTARTSRMTIDCRGLALRLGWPTGAAASKGATGSNLYLCTTPVKIYRAGRVLARLGDNPLRVLVPDTPRKGRATSKQVVGAGLASSKAQDCKGD